MNIILYCDSWPPGNNPNGIVTYCDQMLSGFSKFGHKVHIICRQANGEKPKNCTVVNYDLSLFEKLFIKIICGFKHGFREYYLGYQSILKAIREVQFHEPIDVMEMEESFGWHRPLSKKCHFPIVMRFHGPHFYNSMFDNITSKTKSRIVREKAAFEEAKYVSSPSHYISESVKNRNKTNWVIAEVIPNPIKRFPKSSCWGTTSYEPLQILFVGRFDKHKGGDIVIDAFKKILEKVPQAKLIFAGPDPGIPDDNGKIIGIEEYIKLRLLPKDRDKVCYVGTLASEKVVILRKNANITIIASRIENFSYTALEAIGCSSPTICSKVGGLQEMIEHQRNGLLFDMEDSSDLAEKVITLFNNPNMAQKLGSQGYRDCGEFYDPEVIAKKTIDLYKKAISHYKRQ